MTTAGLTGTKPRQPLLERAVAMRLAATEYARFTASIRRLEPADWARRTECPAWDVRELVAHNLGMAEMAASVLEQRRQAKAAGSTGGLFVDALTAHQVRKHAGDTPEQLVSAYAAVSPRAAKGRRRTPGLVRRRAMPVPQSVNGVEETWTIGYLVDVILTRDAWMHRVDICRAVGQEMHLTADHDGVLVDDVVQEWAIRHGRPFTLQLDGPAGGSWSRGDGGEEIRLDAVEFCRILSGRADGTGLLITEVPF